MKVTVKPKLVEEKKINWKELPVGTMVEFENGVRALVYKGKTDYDSCPALLLIAPDRCFHLEQAKGYLDCSFHKVVKIIGTITEIIVEAE